MHAGMLALAAAGHAHLSSPVSAAESGYARYIKKKKLEPLDSYVPAVLQARGVLLESANFLGTDPKESRIMLRSGAFEGLRDNIRALGEYATSNSAASSEQARDLVSGFFLAVQQYDFVLFDAIRNMRPVSMPEASEKLHRAVEALDRLLATVPQDIVDRAQVIVSGAGRRAPTSEGIGAEALRIERLLPKAQ